MTADNRASFERQIIEPRSNAKFLRPPVPITQTESNWPLLSVSKGFFERAAAAAPEGVGKRPEVVGLHLSAGHEDEDMGEVGGAWDEEDNALLDDDEDAIGLEGKVRRKKGGDGDDDDEGGDGEGGWDEEDLELPPELEQAIAQDASAGGEGDAGFYVAPTRGNPISHAWTAASSLAADHAAAGSFESAARLLHDQLGVVNIEPFKHHFMVMFARSHASFTALPGLMPLDSYPLRGPATPGGGAVRGPPPVSLPAVAVKLNDLVKRLQACYQLTTAGKFGEALTKFRALMLAIPLLVVDSRQELAEAQQMLDHPKTSIEDQRRVCEMAAYFTHVQLQPAHLILTLRTALSVSFKLKCFRTAGGFARRLLELGPKPEIAQQARKFLAACEKTPVDEERLEYDEHNPFSVCGYDHVPIYRGKPEEKCPFCGAVYLPKHGGKLCAVCGVSEIGKDASGLRIATSQMAGGQQRGN
ncbi:unnamed protein product [Notodromas monacha]|uniref:Coatomer alpha subunit C-terminal domain-containing protein n=1 Tax=Notodromas monacha TaxID=399045 RepID=A0A7R9BNR0_9CRUS|nr:unnamed protein product [Notodromas monacha]CAG0918030.1 unnamed protein product [Notodromas monacha]